VTPAAVGLGGNLGRPEAAFRDALAGLRATPGVAVLAASRLWRSEPWGLRDQPEFLNAALLLETSLPPEALLARLAGLERRAGRAPGVRWGPRPLDLDLLFHGGTVTGGPGLTLPHPRLAERTFVLEPLAEVAPDWIHPVLGRTCGRLLAELRASGRGTACLPEGSWAAEEAAATWR
jgi:2-amino-4-hydroxy-6-hydroxymethyldihydropteridine diphosphokinase